MFTAVAAMSEQPVLGKTQLRRAQRNHANSCWKIGALQRAKHVDETFRLEKFGSDELEALARSISVHRSDNASMGSTCRFAATANVAAHAAAWKSKRVFKEHRTLHQLANLIKHEPTELDQAPPPSHWSNGNCMGHHGAKSWKLCLSLL